MDIDESPLARIIGGYIANKKPWAMFAKCHLDGIPTGFFMYGAEKPGRRQVDRVLAYCFDCDVRADCLEHGLADTQALGFFGGLPLGTNVQRQIAEETLVQLRRRGSVVPDDRSGT